MTVFIHPPTRAHIHLPAVTLTLFSFFFLNTSSIVKFPWGCSEMVKKLLIYIRSCFCRYLMCSANCWYWFVCVFMTKAVICSTARNIIIIIWPKRLCFETLENRVIINKVWFILLLSNLNILTFIKSCYYLFRPVETCSITLTNKLIIIHPPTHTHC